jgi:hypothetical protein
MAALRDGKYSDAFAMCSPALQKQVGDVQGLTNMIENGKVKPVNWTFDKNSITNDTAISRGTVTYSDNRESTVELDFQLLGNDWKVTGFHLNVS